MAEVTAKLVKELRDMTGVGMMDAKRALVEVEGDIEKPLIYYVKKEWLKLQRKMIGLLLKDWHLLLSTGMLLQSLK